MSRFTMLGGIYGRPVVFANTALYFISALVLIKAASRVRPPTTLWALAAPAVVLATAYGWLLFRGPLAKELRDRQTS